MITLGDTAKLLATYAIILSIALVTTPRQTHSSIQLYKRTVAVIASRLAFVIASTYYILCYVGGLNADWVVVLSMICLVLSPIASLRNNTCGLPVSSDIEGIFFLAIILAIIGPVYFIKQFVLGFPERDVFVLKPPVLAISKLRVKKTVIHEMNGQSAIVIATLRPTGKIECDGTCFEAISFDGSLIEVGQLVQIGELQNRLYVVHPIPTPL